ncbi:isoflavone reductase family protein [Cercophora newfieldiana]|uniref:Isoflavone reductase family protein n=1 Tax=Cercophora newfieldiana TaxID=92897 RepID=A0AA39XXH6_9PEZI|nr:isoflavone reductase family protein [Cercophora newfieldiana]
MTTPSILIIGAGELGNAVLDALLSHPNRTTTKISLLRRPSTLTSSDPAVQQENTRLTDLGITLEPGDFVNSPVPELASTFRNYHTIIQCSGFGLPPGTQSRVTDAVLEAGVPRYFPWQFGLDYPAIGKGSAQDLFDEMLAVREKLAAQTKTKWTVVSTGLFMSFLFEKGFGVVDLDEKKVMALGGWEKRVTLTAAGDIGRVVAEMVFGEDVERTTLDKVVFVAGDTVTYGEVADVLERVIGGEWEKSVLDMEGVRRELERAPEDGMTKYRGVFAAGRGTAWDVDRTWNHARGMKLVGLEEYLRGGTKG